MHRFYLQPEHTRSDELSLTGREAHHALHVLRLRERDRVTVLDGAGQVLLTELAGHHRDQVTLRVLERHRAPAPPCQITLLQALPKGKLFESIIQKGTELGVARIVPILSERVVSHVDDQKVAGKLDKWHLFAIEAIKQCGQPWLPDVSPPVTIPEFLARTETFDLPLVASLQPGSRHPRHWFEAFRHQHGCNPKSLCVWVGPEGDFTPEEVAQITAAGAHPISLGPLVLRVETAALYCLSVLNYELHE